MAGEEERSLMAEYRKYQEHGNLMVFVFNACVVALECLAAKLGMTYAEVNVWVFCVIGPILFAASIALNIVLMMKVLG